MKKLSLSAIIIFCLFNKGAAQKHVGIGTTNPLAALHVADSNVLFTGPATLPVTPPPPPVSGAGTRMMWYPAKASFRAGTVASNAWDESNTGIYSFATGTETTASGAASTAMGNGTTALGDASTAMGFFSNAVGNYSTALGSNLDALGTGSTAIGAGNEASGDYTTAMGHNASTNNHRNSFCIAGASGDLTAANEVDNQMMMRFDNYKFWISSANYAYLIPASNGWAYTSDKNKKERFEELNGETVLNKISAIPSYSWNFKAADTKQYRHYGIMAQDFYDAFGKDSYGVIGNDTTVSPLDLLGVAYSGIKELAKKSTSLARENEQLKKDNLALQKKMEEIEQQFANNNAINQAMADRLALLEVQINKTMAVNKKK